MQVVVVNFGTENKRMLSKMPVIIAEKNLTIPEEHVKLIISLGTATPKTLLQIKNKPLMTIC